MKLDRPTLLTIAALAVASCSGDADTGNVEAEVNAPEAAAGNPAPAEPALENGAVPAPPQEETPVERPAAEPVPEPASRTPPPPPIAAEPEPDPHAGHDMNNMAHD